MNLENRMNVTFSVQQEKIRDLAQMYLQLKENDDIFHTTIYMYHAAFARDETQACEDGYPPKGWSENIGAVNCFFMLKNHVCFRLHAICEYSGGQYGVWKTVSQEEQQDFWLCFNCAVRLADEKQYSRERRLKIIQKMMDCLKSDEEGYSVRLNAELARIMHDRGREFMKDPSGSWDSEKARQVMTKLLRLMAERPMMNTGIMHGQYGEHKAAVAAMQAAHPYLWLNAQEGSSGICEAAALMIHILCKRGELPEFASGLKLEQIAVIVSAWYEKLCMEQSLGRGNITAEEAYEAQVNLGRKVLLCWLRPVGSFEKEDRMHMMEVLVQFPEILRLVESICVQIHTEWTKIGKEFEHAAGAEISLEDVYRGAVLLEKEIARRNQEQDGKRSVGRNEACDDAL